MSTKSPLEGAGAGAKNADSTPMADPTRINFLSLLGATTGLIASTLPWFWTRGGDAFRSSLGSDWMWRGFWDDPISSSVPWNVTGLNPIWLMFIAGSLAALFTTLGSALQIVSLAVIGSNELDRQSYIGGLDMQGGFDVGYYFAALSAATVFVSFLWPMGAGFEQRKLALRDRVWVFTRPRNKEILRALYRQLVRHKAWAYTWLVTALVLSSMSFVVGRSSTEVEPLTQVGGGVCLSIGPSAPFNNYLDTLSLSVWDYPNPLNQVASWETVLNESQAHEAAQGKWILMKSNCSASNLSVTLLLTLVESMGDGRLGAGDQLVLTATNGTSFADGTEYRMRLYSKLERVFWLDSILIRPMTPVIISFEFLDGEFHSWYSSHP